MADKVKNMVQCLHCKHGTFMQWFQNPIICQCDIFNERFVAETRRYCDEYEKCSTKPEIAHYDHY
ncbi:MAG: hypothetical protein IJ197_05410 [Bacteroidaceae bacterium]|nr:hypothetical protein [Bacteroidaceae bacterium]